MNNDSQFSLWVDNSIKGKFDSAFFELKIKENDISKRSVVEFLLQKWSEDKQIRDEFVKKIKEREAKYGRH